MRHIYLPLATALVLLLAPAASAQQGLFTEKGFGGELLYQSGDGVSEVGVGLGYVVNSLFEAGLAISRDSHESEDWKNTYITPRVRVYPVRQSDSMPVTVFAEGHYHIISVSADDYSDTSASGWGIGAGATHALSAGDVFTIQPYASIFYTGYTEEYTYDGGLDFFVDEPIEFSENPIVFTLGVHGSTGLGSNTVYAAPFFMLSSADGETWNQVGVTIGVVVGQ